MRNALIVVGIGALILLGGWWYFARSSDEVAEVIQEVETAPQVQQEEKKAVIEEQGAAIGDENLVVFQCEGGKSITAVFERDIVGLTLSDGRQIVLRQAASASGIRYLSNDTKIEFRGKGNEGSLIEDGKTTYASCEATN